MINPYSSVSTFWFFGRQEPDYAAAVPWMMMQYFASRRIRSIYWISWKFVDFMVKHYAIFCTKSLRFHSLVDLFSDIPVLHRHMSTISRGLRVAHTITGVLYFGIDLHEDQILLCQIIFLKQNGCVLCAHNYTYLKKFLPVIYHCTLASLRHSATGWSICGTKE